MTKLVVPPDLAAALNISGSQDERTRREQEETMSVALAQPDCAGYPYEAKWPELSRTALGRFCSRHWEPETAHDRWRAGEAYAQLIDAERIACGFMPRGGYYPAAETGIELTLAQMQARKQSARSALLEADGELIYVGHGTKEAMRELAWAGNEIGMRYDGRIVNGLYRLALHFGLEKRPYHGAR